MLLSYNKLLFVVNRRLDTRMDPQLTTGHELLGGGPGKSEMIQYSNINRNDCEF